MGLFDFDFGGAAPGSGPNWWDPEFGTVFGGGSGPQDGGIDWNTIFGSGGTSNGSPLIGNSPTTGTSSNGNPNWAGILSGVLSGIFGGGGGGTGGSGGSGAAGSGSSGSGAGGSGTNNPSGSNAASGANWQRLLAGILNSAIGAVPGLYGAINAGQNNAQMRQDRLGILGNLQTLQGGAQGQMSALNSYLLDQLTGSVGHYGPAAQGALGNQQQMISSLMGSAPGDFRAMLDPNSIPGLSGVFNENGGLIGQGNNALGTLMAQFGQGLNNPAFGQGQSQALQYANGGTPNQQLMNAIGGGLLSSGGNNATTDAAQQAAQRAFASGGMTPALQAILRQGAQVTQGNPAINQAQSVAAGILGHNPLLPMDQVLSMARNTNATAASQNYNRLKRQLLNTQGVGGPALASGSNNEVLSQLGDQALQGESSAMTNALMSQQGLQSQLFGQGANLFGSAQSAGLGAQNLGLQTQLGATGQAANLQSILGNLGLGGVNTSFTGTGLGGNLLNNSSQLGLGGLGALGSLLGTQASSNAANTGALSGLLGQLGNLTQNTAGNLFNAQNLGQQQNQGLYNFLGNMANQQGQLGAQLSNNYNSAMNPLGNMMGNWMNFLGQNTGQQTSLFGNVPAAQNLFTQGVGVVPRAVNG